MDVYFSSREPAERDPRHDRRRPANGEVEVDLHPVAADQPREGDAWPAAPVERRRSERRRIERMGTDI